MADNPGSEPQPAPKLRDAAHTEGARQAFNEAMQEFQGGQGLSVESTTIEVETAPIVRMCNAIIVTAIEHRATDIRLEPTARNVRVRLRVDGLWQQLMTIPKHVQVALINRYKVMAEIPYWRKAASTGHIALRIGTRDYEVWLSSTPTLFGDTLSLQVTASDLRTGEAIAGLTAERLSALCDSIKPGAVLLIIGPPASGKTTLAFHLLEQINSVERNIATVEDQKGLRVPGITQTYRDANRSLITSDLVSMHERSGVDTLLVDDINNADAARAVFLAAENGLAVVGTMVGRDLRSASLLLNRWGIPTDRIELLVSEAVLVRLVRAICPDCREEYRPDSHDQSWLEDIGMPFADSLFRGQGCEQCANSGYRGQIGLFAAVPAHDNATGKARLYADAARKLQNGNTTLEEVMRVV